MSEIELEPCPFCGAEDYADLVEVEGFKGYLGAYVTCENCHAKGPLHTFLPLDEVTGRIHLHNENVHENREDVVPAAIEDWNTRHERTGHAVLEDEVDVCSECGDIIDESWAACPTCGVKLVRVW